MHGPPTKRPRSTRMNRHVRPPYRRKDAQCIIGRLLEGCVAVDCADAEESEGGMVRGEEDGKGVL